MAAADLSVLTAQLLANAPPAAPSLWPPAWPVWALALSLLLTLLAGWFYRRKTARRRRYLRALRQVKRQSAQRRLRQLHALLRNAGGAEVRRLSAAEFAQAVAQTLGQQQPPAWVNAHYRRRAERVNWRDVRRLIRRWCA
ncbi:DUF4381 family protein [Saccharospirillum mangrovi]|uniref:DUF4381 family protein n=1 Tax=Saccharospirillum mangrovi TaxID=2161747 RepID=UPI00130077DA|nr:DUF4381 family protein [Saccharospirillum mangrovi]